METREATRPPRLNGRSYDVVVAAPIKARAGRSTCPVAAQTGLSGSRCLVVGLPLVGMPRHANKRRPKFNHEKLLGGRVALRDAPLSMSLPDILPIQPF